MVDRRLGRGLDFFLTRSGPDTDDDNLGSEGPQGGVQEIEIGKLTPNPFQPRRIFADDELKALADSIRQSGVLQPVLVRRVGDQHQIIAGERRWRAAEAAGLERIPVLVRTVDDDQAAVLALVENLQRSDLNPLEKAEAFERIQSMTGAGQEEVARQVGLERSTVANFVRLLQLPQAVQDHVARGSVSMGQARALLGLEDPVRIEKVADEVVRKRLSVREVETLVRKMREIDPKNPDLDADGKPKRRKPKKEVWLREIESTLTKALDATSVQVRYGRKRSRITIEVEGKDEFERIYRQLKSNGSDDATT